LVEYGRATEAVFRMKLARRTPPHLVARHVVAGDLHVGQVKERHPDVLAVGGRRRTREAIEDVLRLELGAEHLALPEHPAVQAAEAQKQALSTLFQAGGYEDAITMDNGRRVPLAGNRRLPADVFGLAPADGDACFLRCAVATQPAPTWPFLPSS